MHAPIDPPAGTARRRVTRIRGGHGHADTDVLASEVPAAITLGTAALATLLVTPVDLEDFALGFCLSEALIERATAIARIEVSERLEGIEIRLHPTADHALLTPPRERALPARSGCGVCGARTLEDVVRVPRAVPMPQPLPLDALHRALDALPLAQPLNQLTGALHAAAWCTVDGSLVLLREDIGRHNALDKLIGALARAGTDTRAGFLLLTSRASYEMVMKAATVGIGVIAAISAPTALAASLADSVGVTLVGFARAGDAVAYSHAERLRLLPTTGPDAPSI
ncbi:MAG TPA: formate dehydrogenase accessory sulfurtransferase FdhD [Rhodanobacteraceae bacterium]|nr:formate dehydrogenase accessory sulfurtransferase FdhD [Rhodanobacteraceae bacterium]